MVPFGQLEVALVSDFHADRPYQNVLLTFGFSQDMVTKWITDVPLA